MFALARALPLVALAGAATFALLTNYWNSRRRSDDDKDAGAEDASEEVGSSISSYLAEYRRQGFYCDYCDDYHATNFLVQACRLGSFSLGVHNDAGRDAYLGAYKEPTYRTATDTNTTNDLRNCSHQVSLEYAEQEYRYYPLEPVETELRRGEKYREMAGIEAGLRNIAYEESQRSFKSGNRAMAKQLSNKGKLHDEKVKKYNALAAAAFFAYHNPGYLSSSASLPLAQCDLHGLYVEEALQFARVHLTHCRKTGLNITTLIVGKGSHSQAGGAKIKPAMMRMLADTPGLKAASHEINEGRIVVELLRSY